MIIRIKVFWLIAYILLLQTQEYNFLGRERANVWKGVAKRSEISN